MAKSRDVIRLAKQVGIHRFIKKLQDGYNTNVGKLEKKVSGGQNVLIQLLRLCIQHKKPKIIVLDEVNSALNPDTEMDILGKVLKLFPCSTIIVITHKFKVVKDARLIICIKDGRIVEKGSPKKLIKNGRYYARMVRAEQSHCGKCGKKRVFLRRRAPIKKLQACRRTSRRT